MVLRVVGSVVRHHGVAEVVAAVQEDAHQRLVVRGIERRGLADRRKVDGERCRDAHGAELQAPLQDEPAGPEMRILAVAAAHFCTRYSGHTTMRKVAVASMLSFCSCVLAAVIANTGSRLRSTVRVAADSWLAVRRRL